MSNNEIYSKAISIITHTYNKKIAEYEALLEQVRTEIPLLAEFETKLSQNGAKAALAAFSNDIKTLEKLKQENTVLSEQIKDILSAAGLKKPTPDCSVCGDTGLVKGKYCSCVKNLAKKLTLEQLSKHMPISVEKFENFDLKYYSDKPNSDGVAPKKVMTAVLKTAKEYCISFGPNSKNLLFMGGVGLGKTHISLAIVSEIVQKGFSVIYGSAQNIFSDIEKEHFSYSGTTDKLDDILEVDLLVIDDLGTEFSTSFTQSAFYNIVNTRLLNRRPTIINTNLSFKEIEEKYTPRIASRFIGNYEMIKFFGSDIRMQKMINKK